MQNLVNQLNAEISRSLLPHYPKHVDVVEKGHLLYIQGMVRSIRRQGKDVLADVQDVVPVQVKLNSESIYDSECTCPTPFLCKHQMAVFFQLYGKKQSVHRWIYRWKTMTFPLKQKEDKRMNKGILKEQELTDEQKKVLSVYEYGVELVDRMFQKTKNGDVPYSSYYLYTQISNSINMKQYHHWELTPLFHIVANIHFLYRIIEQNQQQRLWESEQLVHTIVLQLGQAIDKLPKPAPFTFDLVYEKLAEDLRELVFLEQPFSNEILTVYWMIWNDVLMRNILRNRELAFAEQTVKKCNPDSLWHAVHSFQWFFHGDTKKAIEVLEPYAVEHFRIVFLYLDIFHQQKNWKGFDVVKPFFLNHYKAYFETLTYRKKQHFVDQLFHYFFDYVEKKNEQSFLETMLYHLLPFSAKPLSTFFLDRKEYRRLIDLYMFSGLEVEAIGQETLKEIQRHEPECLLPLYHQAVNSAIVEKNRASYKRAVRYLKKIRTIYRKLKEEEHWNRYFSAILDDTKRLRAFREECRKGKLIDE
ncbi:SWIM zinc finger family protein [Fervidibacillus albus]|uniref:SWIM zinc finger family protein n=1 Tax=Fervidibacillus albus TaxID=2980026 RepID=A0A9E8LU43_9BACI|nr:SWIM zinc finger family protein [Fervidibacillus albus]WAA09687.1 SWIM zinc finger family protein [Fervidibacillus albus]